jgi:hypothetical protein
MGSSPTALGVSEMGSSPTALGVISLKTANAIGLLPVKETPTQLGNG